MKRLIVALFSVAILLVLNFWLLSPKKSGSLVVPEVPKITPTPIQLDADKLWSLVQNWRISQNLQPYIKDQNMCTLANLRLPEIEIDFSHKDFNNHLHYQQICPNNNCYLAENLAQGYSSEQETFYGWLQSPEHLANLKDNFIDSCIECDKQYCVQEFANYN